MSSFLNKPEGPACMHGGAHGQPGTWKSRTFTSLPPEGGKILYLGVDEHAKSLSSTLAQYRDNVILKIPPMRVPDAELYEACMTNWKVEYPEVGYLVIDTMTAWAKRILQQNAQKKKYSQNPISVKVPVTPGTPGGELVMAAMGDFMPTHQTIESAMTMLLDKPYHTFVIFHSGWETVNEGGIERHIGGPLTVGKAAIASLGGSLNPLFYFSRKVNVRGVDSGQMHTQNVGIWQAKVASPHEGNPVPVYEIPPDPAEMWREFWRVYIKGEKP